MEWKEGEQYTIVSISSAFAFTTKSEIKVRQLQSDGDPVFVFKGKRKLKAFQSNWRTNTIVFKGWDIALKTDTDQQYGTMRGNACFNFLGKPEFVKEFIDKNNLNEYFTRYDSVLAYPDGFGNSSTETAAIPVYPEVATTHAVILGIRKKQGLDKEAPEVVFSYGREEAKEDGILMDNPKKENFPECDIITTNLYNKLGEFSEQRNSQRTCTEIDADHLVGCLMLAAKEQYDSGKFDGDNDKDFFVAPTPNDAPSLKVWFVRNENGRLTAMLPEDY